MTNTGFIEIAKLFCADILTEPPLEPKILFHSLEDLRAFVESFNAEMSEPVFTNGEGLITLKNRNFTHEKNGYIQDNNFDYDAGLQVSGDFKEAEKEAYAIMIASELNSAKLKRI